MEAIYYYERMKKKYPEYILLFRCGDFYECYNEDAKEVSKIVGITLSRKGNTFMAGFPQHATDTYLRDLVRAGKRVALVDYLPVEFVTPGPLSRNISA